MNKYLIEQRKILNSKPIRRLADKTQVLSTSQRNAQIRTRLTHSLEVASISQEIAFNIKYINMYELNPSVLYNISLLHDIGMSPLGHLGESTLNEVSKKYFDLNFEANANNISVIEKKLADISLLTIVSTIKYPYLIKTNEKGKGLYQAQYDRYIPILKEIIDIQNQNNKIERIRTYECDIMEISDDLAYLFSDLEDYLSIVKKEDKISSKEILEIFQKYNLDNPDLYDLFRDAIESGNFEKIESLRADIISDVYFNYKKNTIEIKDEDYKKILKIVRYIDWNYYISKYSLTCESNVIQDYKLLLNYVCENIEDARIIEKYIKSSTKLKEYKEAQKNNSSKEILGKILITSFAELTDTYAIELINEYLKNKK